MKNKITNNKKFILNADDFGLSKFHNQAVLYGYKTGFLKSASLIVNTESYLEAVEISKNSNINLALHLNIMEGKSLTNCPLLTDCNGFFNKNYLYFIFNQNNKDFLKQVEGEFNAQIQKALNDGVDIKRLDSHVHTHAIPKLFEITCKLAVKYDLSYIRTQFEKPYLCKNINLKPVNLIKILLLQHFTRINKKTIKNFNLKTNDYILGVGYTGMMNSQTVKTGLKSLNNGLTECLIHPCKYDTDNKNSHSVEFEITQNLDLKNFIESLGFDIINTF